MADRLLLPWLWLAAPVVVVGVIDAAGSRHGLSFAKDTLAGAPGLYLMFGAISLEYYLSRRPGGPRAIYVVDGPASGPELGALQRARYACIIGSCLTPSTNGSCRD